MIRILVCLMGLLTFNLAHARSLADVVQDTLPSIVYIEVDNVEVSRTVNPETKTITEKKVPSSPITGTGFVIEDNKIVTNYHVIAASLINNTKVHVVFAGGNVHHEAKILGYDEAADVALLQIEGTYPSLKVSETTAQLRSGEPVFTISNFFSFRYSTTTGIVSSNVRVDDRYPYVNILQVQMLEGSGSSGGPVMDMDGDVVSINHTILSMSPNSIQTSQHPELLSTIAFTIRGDTIIEAVKKIKAQGVVKRADLGVYLSTYDMMSEQFVHHEIPGSDDIVGVAVDGVDTENAAKVFHIDDIIIGIEGKAFSNPAKLLSWLDEKYKAGDTVNVQLYREGKVLNIKAKLDNVKWSVD